MRTSLCASTAALALVAASAGLAPVGAADLNIAPIYKPPAAALPTWAGIYVGVAGGGAWGGAVVRNNATGADQTSHFDLAGGPVRRHHGDQRGGRKWRARVGG